MSKLRVGFVGTGGIAGKSGGQGTQGHGFTACEKTEIVAAADLIPATLEQFCRHWNVPKGHQYPNHLAMLENEKLDIVTVCTRTIDHARPVLDAAKAGVKVIVVEKPIATSCTEADEMLKVCRESKSHLIVDHTRRFHKGYQAAAKMTRSGELGRLYFISSAGCRPLLHNGTHNMDLAFYMTNAKPLRVSGFLSNEPYADPGGYGTVVCEGGTVIAINAVPERKHYHSWLEIHGESGRITTLEPKQDWHLYRVEPSPGVGYGFSYIEKPWDVNRSYDIGEWFKWMAEEAADCFIEDRESISTGEDGLKALEAITAMQISHKTCAWVSLPLGEGLRDYCIRSTGQ